MKITTWLGLVGTGLLLFTAACNEAEVTEAPAPVVDGGAPAPTPLERARDAAGATDGAEGLERGLDPQRANQSGETNMKCISDGECASCCSRYACCAACGNGPVVCT
jgi:hypothetical protein